MTKPQHRSRSLRKIARVFPGGRRAVVYERRKPKRVRCPVYGTVLPGVARDLPYRVRRIPRSARRPQRPYGGLLSARASREMIITRARKGEFNA